MVEGICESSDPRIRRTRKLLQQSLATLLKTKDFDEISVGDIAGQATVNRATFYDHYPDKFVLLECVVGSRFHELLAERDVHFDGSCSGALTAIVLAVCEYLTRLRGPDSTRPVEPHMELAVVAVVRRILLEGLQRHPPLGKVTPELIAATAGWAIYGAAKEWAQTPDRETAQELANTVTALVAPILHFAVALPGALAAGPR